MISSIQHQRNLFDSFLQALRIILDTMYATGGSRNYVCPLNPTSRKSLVNVAKPVRIYTYMLTGIIIEMAYTVVRVDRLELANEQVKVYVSCEVRTAVPSFILLVYDSTYHISK